MAITSTCKPSRSSGSPGPCVALGAPLGPCMASSTWGNALTICGVDECTCDQVGTILGAWVYECVRAPSRTQRVGSNPCPHLLTHDLVPPLKPHPTRVNRDARGTYWGVVVRTETRGAQAGLCTELAHWPHSVWMWLRKCPFALTDQVHGLWGLCPLTAPRNLDG